MSVQECNIAEMRPVFVERGGWALPLFDNEANDVYQGADAFLFGRPDRRYQRATRHAAASTTRLRL